MEETTMQIHQPPKLPREVSLTLLSAQTFEVMEGFLQEVGVSDPDVSALSASTFKFALGNVSSQEYVEGIAKEYGIDEPAARKVAEAVVAQVLAPHRDVLDAKIFEAFEVRGGSSVDEGLPPAVSGQELDLAGRQNDGKSEKLPKTYGGGGGEGTDDEELEKELASVKERRAAVIEAKGPLDVPALVKEICENPAFAIEDAALKVRCEKIVESRVRGVRSPEQARAQLERSVEKGGLGMSGRRLSDMLQFLEARVAAFQGRLEARQQQERVKHTAATAGREELAKKEETLMTKRYVELTGKVPAAHVAPAAPSVTRTSVALSAHHEQQAREGKIDAQKVKAAVQNAQPAPSRPAHKPGMQEVVFTKRLTGPVDELRTLTLDDFRRLSKDPMQAAVKIKDKVELLEEQGAHKKAQAIEAWRSSPLNQQYVALTREAVLGAQGVMELLAKKRAAGELTLTDDELGAIMQVNGELRF